MYNTDLKKKQFPNKADCVKILTNRGEKKKNSVYGNEIKLYPRKGVAD